MLLPCVLYFVFKHQISQLRKGIRGQKNRSLQTIRLDGNWTHQSEMKPQFENYSK